MEGIGQYKDITPELEQIHDSGSSSLFVACYQDRYFDRSWHHHPEYELLLITNGFGQRFVGDHSEQFKEGDLVLMGPRLPHAWISDPVFREPSSEKICRSVYIQFKASLFDSGFENLNELRGVQKLLQRSKRGLKVTGSLKDSIIGSITELPDMDPLERLLGLIRILDMINSSPNKTLASEDYLEEKIFFKSRRMTRIHHHLVENYRRDVSLDEAAGLVNMTRTSFCRFFKNQTGSTYTYYLNRIRIDFARRLLQNTEMHIKEVGYDCGFSSIPYFHQTFKRFTGISPRQFRLGGGS